MSEMVNEISKESRAIALMDENGTIYNLSGACKRDFAVEGWDGNTMIVFGV